MRNETESIVLIDASADALTISWPEEAKSSTRYGLQRYVLQYKKTSDDNSSFETLSDQLSSTQIRKRNLTDPDNAGFYFRVASRREAEEWNDEESTPAKKWITHDKPFLLLTQQEEQSRMEKAPTVSLAGSNLAVCVSWTSHPEAAESGYELQMRENTGGCHWVIIYHCAPQIHGHASKSRKRI
jgi:hypothetical protein